MSKKGYLLLLFYSVISLTAAAQTHPWSNGQAASFVLGQQNFTGNNSGAGSAGMNFPQHIVTDPTNGKLFVADGKNNRVLRFPATAVLTSGAQAEAVLGQPDFNSTTAGVGANGMSDPTSLAIDASGTLWVADFKNNRVLRFSNAVTISSGSPADGVLGQSGFSTNIAGVAADSLDNPVSVFVSGSTLWVSDLLNNRVLRFDNAASKSNGASADAVLGQPDFTSNRPNIGSHSLNFPGQLFIDKNGNLWIIDVGNNRLLRFSNAASLTNGADATAVLGQPDFNSGLGHTTAHSFLGPVSVTGDVAGHIYVGEAGSGRVLVFNNAALLPNGADASNVLGLSNFTSIGGLGNSSPASASNFVQPGGLFADSKLFVTDPFNNRVLIFTPAISLPLKLISFTGTPVHNREEVLLEWRMGYEESGARYELFNSIDGIHFDQLLYSTGATGGISNRYSYSHSTPVKGLNYYRLKITDVDGHYSFSPILKINTGNAAAIINFYPNPAQENIIVSLPSVEKALIIFYDAIGRQVKTEKINAMVAAIDISMLSKGFYTISIVQGYQHFSSRLIKQ